MTVFCFSYLGGHDSVITEFGWYERLSGRTGMRANIDCSVVYSSLIATKLENNRELEGGKCHILIQNMFLIKTMVITGIAVT